MGQGQVFMDTISEEGWSGERAEKRVTCRLSVLEEEFPGISAKQAAADRLYRKGSHEEGCVLETQAFLGDTSAKVQLTIVSVQKPACYFSLVHLGLAGTGLREPTGQCQLLPVTREGVPHTTALEHSRSTVKQEVSPLAHLSPTLVANTRGQPQVPQSSPHGPACS